MPKSGVVIRFRCSASSRGSCGSKTSTLGLSGRVELTLITSAKRSSVSCTTEPAGYTPIMRMKEFSMLASNCERACANSSDSASCGVSALASDGGLHRLS
jgi:hypothetical protein